MGEITLALTKNVIRLKNQQNFFETNKKMPLDKAMRRPVEKSMGRRYFINSIGAGMR